MLGIVVGLWYLVIPAITLLQSKSDPRRPVVPEALIVIGIIGWRTVGGWIGRPRKRVSGSQSPAVAVAASVPTGVIAHHGDHRRTQCGLAFTPPHYR